jgi:hypothetical protein
MRDEGDKCLWVAAPAASQHHAHHTIPCAALTEKQGLCKLDTAVRAYS